MFKISGATQISQLEGFSAVQIWRKGWFIGQGWLE